MRLIALLFIYLLLPACAITQWQPSQYTVKRGDSLYAIAWRYDLDYKKLAKWNDISAPYVIHPGEKLWIGGEKPAYLKEKKPSIASTASTVKKPVSKPVRKPKPTSPRSSSQTKVSWQWPLNKPYTIKQKYKGENSDSQGLDISSKRGEAVYAAASGKVVYSGNGLIGYGNLLIIKHNDVFLSAYALNEKLFAKEGDSVVKGQKIASVGLNADRAPTLHFEIRRNGKPINPIKYLP